jgi:hypothetical protein
VLLTHAGTIIDFYVGYPLKINGVRIRDPFQPSDLVLGKTTATVTYWTTIYQQKSVHATDQIDY